MVSIRFATQPKPPLRYGRLCGSIERCSVCYGPQHLNGSAGMPIRVLFDFPVKFSSICKRGEFYQVNRDLFSLRVAIFEMNRFISTCVRIYIDCITNRAAILCFAQIDVRIALPFFPFAFFSFNLCVIRFCGYAPVSRIRDDNCWFIENYYPSKLPNYHLLRCKLEGKVSDFSTLLDTNRGFLKTHTSLQSHLMLLLPLHLRYAPRYPRRIHTPTLWCEMAGIQFY